ncbi:nicotinate-nucleotide--dimethylbenzimidazole phosphoribosyltransferase [Novosphingobium sp. UBA1939]|uniref:nicotinate-nucleotide--dimethylbenzimidazole phosphoribosyltransferase n=1 Tax=Novosphingobium sp. UBA1939 TaxID=1946982 RepID=UPI0025D16FDF|nr:nicotinate-nucleotide--dimethylbenzimidazole phosphoribosyltransferase [Novosphingobium sp. UBA1939]
MPASSSSAFASLSEFAALLAASPAADATALAAAAERNGQLTKPPGALGRLEDVAIWIGGWQGRAQPRIDHPQVVIFAGNHGVTAQGVSAFPSEVTVQMVANFRHGGAAINQLARLHGAEVEVVALELDRPTADFTESPAMTEGETVAALQAGWNAVNPKADILVVGEMGIGNTTAAAALAAASFGGTGADWVGPGTGVDAAGVARKAAVVDIALAHHAGQLDQPFEILRRVGGREIVAIAGAIVAARHARVPILLDGFIGTAAIAPLARGNAAITDHCLAGHCSAEPGHRRLLDRLGLSPLLALDMRLGEGSGAAVAAQIVRAALAAHDGMATFAEAGIAGG